MTIPTWMDLGLVNEGRSDLGFATLEFLEPLPDSTFVWIDKDTTVADLIGSGLSTDNANSVLWAGLQFLSESDTDEIELEII